MDPSVTHFFAKGADEGYAATYRLDHSPRIQSLLNRYGLKESLKGKRVADIGGGLGFLGELLDPSTDYWVIDGADIPETMRYPSTTGGMTHRTETERRIRDVKLAKGTFVLADLDRDAFATPSGMQYAGMGIHTSWSFDIGQFDAAFCLETLEHLSNPYHALVEMKKLVKQDGMIYLSVPSESVWHNVVYPALLWPPGNFVQFLGQMALQVVDHWEYKPAVRGWPAYHYSCINRPWSSKVMAYPKAEAKFLHATPLECTNL